MGGNYLEIMCGHVDISRHAHTLITAIYLLDSAQCFQEGFTTTQCSFFRFYQKSINQLSDYIESCNLYNV